MVSIADSGWEVAGSIPIRGIVGFFLPDRLLPRVECAMGSNGKTGTTQSSFIHFTDALLSVLLTVSDQHCRCLYLSGLVDAGIYYERKRRVQPCHVVSDRNGTP